MQFNLHTHKVSEKNIYNLRIGIDVDIKDPPYYFSAGIHPWDIEAIDIPMSLQKLSHYLKQKNCISLGEIGLDKVCGTNLDYQKEVLRAQLHQAHYSNTKVLIIHSVKSYQEIIKEKLNCPYEFIWILHAFNGSSQLIKQLLKHGFYFSLGSSLLNSKMKISTSISSIPLDRLFLETDESNIGIDVIYKKTATLLELDLTQIETQIENNIRNIFDLDLKKLKF